MKSCQWCDVEFKPNVAYQIYCSPDCRGEATKEKIADRYARSRRNKMITKERHCKFCGVKLSAYNDDILCQVCLINPADVSRALRQIKGIANGKPKFD